MKKILLMAAIAASTMTANAQLKLDVENISKNFSKCDLQITTEDNSTRGAEITNMYYFRPQGLFYSGWNRSFMSPGISYAPVNTDITFSAYYSSGTPVWGYANPELDADGNLVEENYAGSELTLNYSKPGLYYTPVLVNKEDKNDQFTGANGYMHVGTGIHRGEEEVNGEMTIMDGYAVNYTLAANLKHLAFYLATNDPKADQQFAGVAGDPSWHTVGFGEAFSSPADFVIKGFNGIFFADDTFAETSKDYRKVKISLMKFVPNQGMEEIVAPKALKGHIETFTMVPPQDGVGMYEVEVTLPEPITVKAGEKIVPFFKSERVLMSPMFDGQPKYDEQVEEAQGISTMFVCNASPEGDVYQTIPLTLTDNKTGEKFTLTSWMIGLDMAYGSYDPSTGIEDVTAEEVAGNGAVYSIAGVKVSDSIENLPAGIYVKDGKKFVVR